MTGKFDQNGISCGASASSHDPQAPPWALVRMVLLNFYAGDDDPTLNMPDSLREVP